MITVPRLSCTLAVQQSAALVVLLELGRQKSTSAPVTSTSVSVCGCSLVGYITSSSHISLPPRLGVGYIPSSSFQHLGRCWIDPFLLAKITRKLDVSLCSTQLRTSLDQWSTRSTTCCRTLRRRTHTHKSNLCLGLLW